MNNPTDTNQASEDELRTLDEILSQAFTDGASDTMWIADRHVEIFATAKEELLNLIRTEKLKLLAEVRERVVGENQHSEHKEWDCPCGATHSFTEEWHATNRLRDEQRVALTKLEAEL